MRFLTVFALAAVAVLGACSSEEGKGAATPEVVENHPGALSLTTPARAAFVEQGSGGSLEVVGTGGSIATTVNGRPVKLAADGTFRATIAPTAGLNVVTVVDGSARLESPFVYGHFVPVSQPVGHALTMGIGSDGFGAAAPAASLTTVVTRALRDRNLVAALAGKSFSGSVTGVGWKYDVSGGHNDATAVALDTAPQGVKVAATGNGVVVEGTLTLSLAGIPYSRPTRIIVDRAHVSGTAALAMNDGVLGAAMPEAAVSFDGFHWDTDDLGFFPCCVDTIVGSFLRPKIEDTITTSIKTMVPEAVKISLDGVGLPPSIDLSALGLTSPIAIQAKFDDGVFDAEGSTISAAVLFGGSFPAGSPGAKAPGFLPLGGTFANLQRPAGFGATLSVDAVNQLLFSIWGSGQLSYTAPGKIGLTVTPKLPPMLGVTPAGAVRIQVGELVVQKVGQDAPIAAVTVIQDVVPTADANAISLAATGEPTISITFLADEGELSGNGLIASAAKGQVKALLSPLKIPLPKVALDKLGAPFAGSSLAIQTLKIAADGTAGRLGIEGSAALLEAAH